MKLSVAAVLLLSPALAWAQLPRDTAYRVEVTMTACPAVSGFRNPRIPGTENDPSVGYGVFARGMWHPGRLLSVGLMTGYLAIAEDEIPVGGAVDLLCLHQVRAVDPEITLALIGNGPEILMHARQKGIPWIHGKHRTVDKELVAHAHGQGIRVNVWTVDDPETLPFWRSVGVDKICTNRPALMVAAARARHGQVDHPPCTEYRHCTPSIRIWKILAGKGGFR